MRAEQMNYFKNLFENVLKDHSQMEKDQSPEAVVSFSQNADDVDQTQQDQLKFVEFRLKARKSRYMKKIQQALLRIQEGSFGVCSECEGDIDFVRLKARPESVMCIHCKEEQEHSENQTRFGHGRDQMDHTVITNNVLQLKVKDDGNAKSPTFEELVKTIAK